MEAEDHTLITRLVSENFRLKRLYERHMKLESRLARFEKRRFLTVDEEVEQKQLKQEKLRGVDRMMTILQSYRHAA